jgi:hypothetical protein
VATAAPLRILTGAIREEGRQKGKQRRVEAAKLNKYSSTVNLYSFGSTMFKVLLVPEKFYPWCKIINF